MKEKNKLWKFCTECSLCCSYPVVLPEERERIIKEAGLGFRERRFFKKMGNYYIIDGDPCPFLEGNRCRIEKVKPLNCRIFPLVILREPEPKWVISPDCVMHNRIPKSFIAWAKKEGKRLLELHKVEYG